MTGSRRRKHPSDWLLALHASRRAKRLRLSLPSSTGFTEVGADRHSVSHHHSQLISVRTSDDQVNSNQHTMQHACTDVRQQEPSYRSEQSDEENSIPALETSDEGIEALAITSAEISMGEDTETHSCAGYPHGTNTIIRTGHRRTPPRIAENNPDLISLAARREKWKFRLNLTAMIAVVGSVRFTVQQYEYTRDVLKDVSSNPDDNWPPYSKTQMYFKEIIEHCLPESRIISLPKFQAKNDSFNRSPDPALDVNQRSSAINHENQESERVRIFLPSAWARLDVATSVVFDDMYPEATDTELNSVNLYPIIQDRRSVTGVCDSLMINHRGRCVPCGPGSEIVVTLQNDKPRFKTAYQFIFEEESYKFAAVINTSWCVGARGHPNQSFNRAMAQCALTNSHKTIAQYFSVADERPSNTDSDIARILPGDLCTILSAQEARTLLDTDDFTAVLVHRFWRFEEGIPSMFICWVTTNGTTAAPVVQHAAETHIVKEFNLRRLSPQPRRLPKEHASRGTLSDGTPYVVYRILLYCDDFQKSSQHYPRGSAGGCYFLPLSLPPEKRRTTSAVRVISLTPPGVSTNQILQYIIDDLVHATTVGINGATPDGSPVKIFIDIVGFVGDYPAAAAAVDVIGHVSNAPCTLCTFRRQHASVAEGSRYGYTTDVHAGHSSFLRHAERHVSLRQAGISAPDANFLGMVSSERMEKKNCPLVDLCEEMMRKQEQIPFTTAGNKVVPCLFDPYRSNIIAPDHLLTGLAKDVINTVFLFMPNVEMRAHADVYICSALRENGLLHQRTIYNQKSKSLHSMTLSELYCVLLVASTVLKNVISTAPPHHPSKLSFSLLQKLQKLIGLTYWDPKPEIDGREAYHYLNGGRSAQLSALKNLSKEYVQAVDEFCRQFKVQGAHLDKPNLHRLVELYEHTIPAFGHVREVMELVFESAHQPLKRGIARSNNHDPHLFACEHCVGNDWQGRIASLSRELDNEDPAKRKVAYRGLRRLLIGAESDLLNDIRDKEFISETDAIIVKQLTNSLKRQFQRANQISNFGVDKLATWKARTVANVRKISQATGLPRSLIKDLISTAGRWILAIYPEVRADPDDETPIPIKIFMYAKRVRENENGRQMGSTQGFDVISPNTVVQLHTTQEKAANKIVNSKEDPHSIRVFFAVIAVLHRENDMVWLICARCDVRNDQLRIGRDIDIDTFQIVSVTSNVRRVGLYHVCADSTGQQPCKVDVNKRAVNHSHSLLHGAWMYFQTRKEGFPPRQG